MTSETWTVTGPQIIDVEHINALDATILTGRIDVVAHDDPTRTDARVEVHAVDGRPLEIRLDGGRLRVGYGPTVGGWKGFLETFRTYSGKDTADVHVAVPADAHVKLSTVRGDGLVAGVRAGVRVATVSGAVMTSHTTGALRVDTVSGDVTVSEHDGSIAMDSVSGELTATGALDDVKLDSVSGGITLDTRRTPSAVLVNAVSADVLVRLPDPGAMDYAVRCVSGRLLVDGVEYRGTATSFKRPADPAAGASSPLRLSAVSGNVTVLRAADPGEAYGEYVPPTDVSDGEVHDAPGAVHDAVPGEVHDAPGEASDAAGPFVAGTVDR